ncbi:hypothetical protein CSHISOI_07966 [Colletotrichum shisoi]|uniref:Uncharacterized protein n=1 Tax=Colletotrichum shisoi TaxID=2078593 RepID=A0A5Q4BKH1_9PEZI|nr:hypothetical protein CSHISOI_07966 [Colletotrichum shisoi]
MRWPRPAVCVLERTVEALEGPTPNEAPLLVFTISKLTMAVMTFHGQKKGRGKRHQRYARPDQRRRPEARNNVGAVSPISCGNTWANRSLWKASDLNVTPRLHLTFVKER